MSIDLSLDRIRRLQAVLTPYTRPTCHITGTNGKGSVSAFLSSIFIASSARVVGRFNSPHLVTVRDCITLNNNPVSPEVYDAARAHVERTNTEHEIGASSFELLTCTALHIFEHARADIVVLEVGMGGRLDATNVIPDEAVLVSALTAVDLDHQAFLGGTVSAIAREKAAIARRGKPFVLGAQVYPEVESVVRQVVGQAGGEVWSAATVTKRQWDDSIDGPRPHLSSSSLEPPLPQPIESRLPCFSEPLRALLSLNGEHQLANLGIALGVISAICLHPSCTTQLNWTRQITPQTVANGVKATVWPGRLSFHRLTSSLVLVDGAHNPASARTLAEYVNSLLTRLSLEKPSRPLMITYLVALSHSPPKSPADTLAPLLSVPASIGVALLPFTPPEGMPWVRPESRESLRTAVAKLAPDAEVWESDNSEDESPLEQLRSALDWARTRHQHEGGDGLVVVAGSLYLVADFYRVLSHTTHASESLSEPA